jgi:hypothetical protein
MIMTSGNIDNETTLPPATVQRDEGVTLIAFFHFLISAAFLLATVVLAFPTLLFGLAAVTVEAGAVIAMFAVGLMAAVAMVFCVLFLSIGYGLWTLRQWARVAAIALAVVSLAAFPIGTVLGGLILWHLLKPEVAARFE